MALAIDEVMAALAEVVDFDLRLGGINVDSTRPVGAYGRRRLDALWNEVTAVTGQTFSHELADGTIYNSVLPCRAVEAMRDLTGQPPFEMNQQLQRRFFVESVNVNDRDELIATAVELGVDAGDFERRLSSAEIRARTDWEFKTSRRYGTNALPSVLVSTGSAWFDTGGSHDYRLLAGGYVSAAQLKLDIQVWLDSL